LKRLAVEVQMKSNERAAFLLGHRERGDGGCPAGG
jgi:hypothetical protein